MTWEIYTLAALGFVFLNLLAVALVRGGSAAQDAVREANARRLRRHGELWEAMVFLESKLGRIPTIREVWAQAELEDSGGEPPAGESG